MAFYLKGVPFSKNHHFGALCTCMHYHDEFLYDINVARNVSLPIRICLLGGGFKWFIFSPLFGEDSHFD